MSDGVAGDRELEDAAVVVTLLACLAVDAPAPDPPRALWGSPAPRDLRPGPHAWWASGLPR